MLSESQKESVKIKMLMDQYMNEADKQEFRQHVQPKT